MPLDPDALLATLTLAQKVALLAGSDGWHTERVPGVPVLRCTDGPAGARGTSWNGPRSASFPCSTALGASFDPELVEEVGRALGREARSKGAQMLLAPTVNLHRTPIGGRNFVVGVPALRLRGLYLAVTTFAFGLTVQFWLLNDRFFGWFPRSDQRLQRPPLFGRISIDSPTRFYVYSVVVLALVSLGVRGVRRSRTGRVIVALRENERAAQSFAVPLVRAKLTAFVLSGVVAGVGGALFVHLNQSFVVASYDTGQSFSVFTAAVVGGLGSVGGAFLGALYLRGTQWFITSQEWQVLSSGVGVLVVLLVLPSGLGGLWVRLRDLVVSRIVRAAPVTEPADPGDAAGTIAPEVA